VNDFANSVRSFVSSAAERNAFPLSAIVCGDSSSFTQVTVVPGAIVNADGLKAKSLMTMTVGVAAVVAVSPADVAEAPATRTAATSRDLCIGCAP
jgi:hypothetical protein